MYVLPVAGYGRYFYNELAEMKGEISQRIITEKLFLWELSGWEKKFKLIFSRERLHRF